MKYLALPFLFVIILLVSFEVNAQQRPDTTFTFFIAQSAYQPQQGPLILIDDAHHNFHTRSGGFLPFSNLLERDGYRVKGLESKLTDPKVLKGCQVLVLANALHQSNIGNWTVPNPSAFTKTEIETLKKWVKNGGSLLLIADHMPFAGAAQELGRAFGFEFLNGFARTGNNFWPPSVFSEENKGLVISEITNGRQKHEKTDRIATFTGSAFSIPKKAIPVLKFSDAHVSLQPDTAWRFNSNTPSVRLKDYYQGAVLQYGKGKVAVFGEAAMFTAQIANGNMKAGFNSEFAPQNAQFVLNLTHWLDGVQEYSGPENKLSEAPDRKAILQLNREMENAFKANDFQKLAGFYADNAVMVGNKHEVNGRNAIDQYWLNLKDRGVSWELENTSLEIFENVAIQRGISRMKFKHENKVIASDVRFTLVWKKINGAWLITLDHYSLL